jgi:hypothetical protein
MVECGLVAAGPAGDDECRGLQRDPLFALPGVKIKTKHAAGRLPKKTLKTS